jgi:hypothetical protein
LTLPSCRAALGVNQVERLVAGLQGGVPLQIVLGRHPLALAPALALIDAHDRHQAIEADRTGLGDEGVHVGALVRPPTLPEAVLRPHVRGGRRGV